MNRRSFQREWARLAVCVLTTLVTAVSVGCSSARLDASQVGVVADNQAMVMHSLSEDDVRLFYPDREARFDKSTRRWRVSYARVPSRGPGDSFAVYVNDATGDVLFTIGGR